MIGNMVMNLDLIVKYLSVKCQSSASPVPNLFTCTTLSSISIQVELNINIKETQGYKLVRKLRYCI